MAKLSPKTTVGQFWTTCKGVLAKQSLREKIDPGGECAANRIYEQIGYALGEWYQVRGFVPGR